MFEIVIHPQALFHNAHKELLKLWCFKLDIFGYALMDGNGLSEHSLPREGVVFYAFLLAIILLHHFITYLAVGIVYARNVKFLLYIHSLLQLVVSLGQRIGCVSCADFVEFIGGHYIVPAIVLCQLDVLQSEMFL